MSLRTDLRLDPTTRKVVAANTVAADTSKPLPKVTRPDVCAKGHGEVWKKQAEVEDMALNALATIHDQIANAFDSFLEQRERRDPSTTQAAHLSQLAISYNRHLDYLSSAATKAQETAKRRLEKLEDEFRQTINWRTTDAAELRGVIRSMDQNTRAEVLGEAVNSGDGHLLGAVLSSHPAAVGMTKEQHQGLRRRAMMKARPDLLKLEDALRTASYTVREGFTSLMEAGPQLTAKEIRDQYEREAQAAKRARDRISIV